MTVTDWQIPGSAPGSSGQPILGNTHPPEGGVAAAQGVMVICHGFKGYKDYGFFPMLADEAAKRGLIAHRFNFSHSGMTNSIETFERPELFEADTWSKQVADVAAVAAAMKVGIIPGAGLPLILFGHSRGGITALLAAVELGGAVDGVITAAAPHDACFLDKQQRDQLRKSGRLASPSSRTGQTLYVGKDWLDEIEANPGRFDPVKAIAKIKSPVLILHGKDDQTVPYVAAHVLHDAPGSHTTLHIIEGASHTFNAPNPLALDAVPPPQTREMIDEAVKFAVRCCRS